MKSVSRSMLPRYGVAGVSTVLATLAQLSLRPIMGNEQPFSFFYVAVMVTAWYGGLRRALSSAVQQFLRVTSLSRVPRLFPCVPW